MSINLTFVTIDSENPQVFTMLKCCMFQVLLNHRTVWMFEIDGTDVITGIKKTAFAFLAQN